MKMNAIFIAFLLVIHTDIFAQTESQEPALSETPTTEIETPDAEPLELFAAIETGDVEKVKPILTAMSYYEKNKEGETALTAAIKAKNVPMVKLLVEDAVINLKNKDGETPLTLALKEGNSEIIDLVMVRASAAAKNDKGQAPLFLAIELTDDLRLLQRLVDKGAKVDRMSNGETPLALATRLNKLKSVAFLVKNGANVSKQNENGDSPLYIAVAKGHEVIAGILAHKSEQAQKDVNWQTSLGEPLLNIAAMQNNTHLVHTLLDFGAEVNAPDYMDNTALNIAASKGNQEMIEKLLLYGADVNHRNIMGSTPIMSAAQKGNVTLANFLAEQGANPEIQNYEGLSASQFANFDNILVKRALDEADSFQQAWELKKGEMEAAPAVEPLKVEQK